MGEKMSKTISKKQILMLKKDIEDAIERYENSNKCMLWGF
jgi:hypothetical protein